MLTIDVLKLGSCVVMALGLAAAGCAADADDGSEPDIRTTTNSTLPGPTAGAVAVDTPVQEKAFPTLVQGTRVWDTVVDTKIKADARQELPSKPGDPAQPDRE